MKGKSGFSTNGFKYRFHLWMISFLLLVPFLYSCKSGPKASDFPEVDPLALLQEDSSIYVRVPVTEHDLLVKSILLSELPYVSEGDAVKLVKQLDVIYAGLGTVQDRSRLEIAASGEFPSFARSFVFSKKNGWKKSYYTGSSSLEAKALGYPFVFDVLSSDASSFDISFPSDGILLLAKDVCPGLDFYAQRRDVPDSFCNEWLLQGGDDISFFIGRPGQYLRKMIGSAVTISCESVYGKLKKIPDPKGKNKQLSYEMEFYVRLNQNQGKAMTMLSSLLNLALRQMDGHVEQADSLTLKITGMSVSEREIIDLFTMDPITGKHFRVEGDKIFTE